MFTLDKSRGHLEAIYDVSRLCAQLEPTPVKIPGVLQALGAHCPVRSALLYDGSAAPPLVAAWRSHFTGGEPSLRAACENLKESVARLLGGAVVLPGMEQEDAILLPERLSPVEVEAGAASTYIVMPLTNGREPFGVLQVETPRRMSELDLGLLTEAANQISLSLVRDRAGEKAVSAHRRLAFLAEASGMVNGSFDHAEFLPRIAQLAIRDMGDVCAFDVPEGALQPPSTIRASRLLGEYESGLEEVMHRFVSRVLGTGTARVASAPCDSLAEPLNLETRKALRKAGIQSALSVPLLSKRATIGALTLLSADADRYGPADLFILEDVARRVACAIDAGRLFRKATQTIRDRDELLEVVSQDLGGSLAQILLTVTATKDKRRAEEVRQDLESLRVETSSVCRTLVDLLDSARAENRTLRIAPKDVRLTSLMEKATAAARPAILKKEIKLDVRVRRSADELYADPARMEQVLSVLLTNAIDSSDPGGPVVVRAQRVEKHVRVLFTDTGKPIPSDALPHVFDRFWRVRHARALGPGLGLPIAKGIVEAHGGMIWVESQQGKGTTFTFSLPVS